MAGNEEMITEESIKVDEEGIKRIMEIRSELIRFADELARKDEQIAKISRKANEQLHHPIRPSTLNLQEQGNLGWNNYFEDVKVWIQRNKTQEECRKQLEGLEKERKDIASKIIKLVPPNFYNVQIIFNSRYMNVNADNVTL